MEDGSERIEVLKGDVVLRIADYELGTARVLPPFNEIVAELVTDKITSSTLRDDVLNHEPADGVHAYFLFREKSDLKGPQ